jgi:hypothetical protein
VEERAVKAEKERVVKAEKVVTRAEAVQVVAMKKVIHLTAASMRKRAKGTTVSTHVQSIAREFHRSSCFTRYVRKIMACVFCEYEITCAGRGCQYVWVSTVSVLPLDMLSNFIACIFVFALLSMKTSNILNNSQRVEGEFRKLVKYCIHRSQFVTLRTVLSTKFGSTWFPWQSLFAISRHSSSVGLVSCASIVSGCPTAGFRANIQLAP